MIGTLLDQDVELLASSDAAADPWGNVTGADWSTVGTYRGRLDHTTSQEIAYAGDTVVTDWQLFLDPAAPITARHRVRVDGRTFQVVGEPAPIRGIGATHHLEVRLVAVGGA